MAQTEEQRILDIKVRYSDAINGIAEYKKKIDELKSAEKELQKGFKDGSVSEQEYRKGVVASKEAAKDYQNSIRILSKEVQNNIKKQQEAEGSLRQLRAELSNATKAYDSLSRAERESAKGKALQQHIKDITAELKGAEEETDRFYRNVGNYKNSIAEALTGNNKFASSLMSMAQEGGNVQGFFSNAIGSVKAFGSALMGLMANPVFLGIAGIAGVGVAFKWFYDYNQSIAEATRLTKEFFGLSGEELQATRDSIQATADTFDKDYKEVLSTADALVSQYGISVQEAMQVINDGFISGADLSGDMLQKIQNYAPTFHDAGIEAKSLVAIIAQTRSGIFSDSGMAVIEMASKRIREMSTATADSLNAIGISSEQVQKDLASGAKSTFDVIQEVSTKMKEFGADSTEVGNVLKDVFGKSGAGAGIKLIEQLDTMSTKLEDLKKITGEYGEAQEEQLKAQKELNNATSALFDMSGKGFETMKMHLQTIATKWLTSVVKGTINCINYFIKWYNNSLLLRGAVQSIIVNFKSLWETGKLLFNLLITGVKNTINQFRALGDIIEGIVTFNWDKIKNGFAYSFNSAMGVIKDGWKDIKAFGSNMANTYVDAFSETLNGRLSEITIPEALAGGGSGGSEGLGKGKGKGNGGNGKNGKDGKTGKNKSTATDQAVITKAEEQELRKAEDLLNQLVESNMEQRRKMLETQYDRQIKDLNIRLETEKKLTITQRKAIMVQIEALEKIKQKKLKEFDIKAKDEALKREAEYINNMLTAVDKNSKEEYELKIQKIRNEYQLALDAVNSEVMTEEERARAVKGVREKYYKQEEDAYKDYHNNLIKTQEDAIKKRYELQILQLDVDSKKDEKDKDGEGDINTEIEKLRLEVQMRKEILDNARQMEGESIEEFNARKLQYEEKFQQAKKALSDKEVQIEKAKTQAINMLKNGVGDVLEAFSAKSKTLAKASKILALGEIAVNTGVALAKGIKAAQDVGYPQNLIAIATTVSTILSNIATATKTVQGAKFAKGGDVVGPGTGTSDSVPAMLSNGESVMTAAATQMFAPALNVFNQIGGGAPITGSPAVMGTQIGEEFLANAVARGMAMAPRPVVSVEEINGVSNRVEVIERMSRIW